MRTSYLNAPWRFAASFALAAVLLFAARVEAAPTVNISFYPNSLAQGGVSQMLLIISDDLSGGFTGGTIASFAYPAGLVNANPSIYYDSCGGSTTATPGANSMSVSGIVMPAFSSCYIYINVTSSSANSYTVNFPIGGITASSGSNTGNSVAVVDFIAPTLVTTNADSGAGSLRQAILDTNGSCASGSSISFNIGGAGPHTIQPLSQLPALTCGQVILNAYQQSGAAKNTDTTGGNNASIQIALDGSLCSGCDGLTVLANGVEVWGFAIHSFGGAAIRTNASAMVHGNYLGTDPGGMTALPNAYGVVTAGGYSTIGMGGPGDTNLIAGNTSAGIYVTASSAASISGNQIGGRRDGSAGMANGYGIYFFGANYSRSYVEYNFIRYNTGPGVVVDSGSTSPVIFTMNSMHGNSGPGIDLIGDGPTLNDETGPPYDADGGPNGLANYPVITSVVHSGSDTIVQGYLKSAPGSDATIQLFDNPTLPSTTEGAKPIFSFGLSLDANGAGSFTQTIPGYLASYVSAAVTIDTCGDGCVYSSEYSPAVGVSGSLSCSMFVQIPAVGDAGVIGSPDAIAPPGASAMIQPLCNEAPTSMVWSTSETTSSIAVTAPAAGVRAAYSVTVTSAGGSGTFTVGLVGALAGTPVCTITPAVPLPIDPLDTTPFNITSSCSPAATGYAWSPYNLVGGQGTATGTYQMSGTPVDAGYGHHMLLTPTNAAGDGPTATRIIWIGAAHVDTKPLAFPTTPAGSQSAPQAVPVQNFSDYFTPYLSLAVTGPFVVTNNCATPVPALGNCTIDVRFAPSVAGAGQTGSLTVSYGFPGNPSYTVPLSGDATGAPAVTITPNPASLTFAARTVSTTSAPQTVTVANTGTLTLNISSISITGDFAYASTCPASLVPGASCTIDVTFTPLVVGARTGTLTITDDAAGSPHTVSLNGTGLSTSAAVADVSPTALDFPPQSVGTDSPPQAVTVTNSGTAPLTFASIIVTGEYSVATLGAAADPAECPLTLAPGDSCQIGIIFRPTGFNLRSGTLSIETNVGTVTVRLVGTGLVLAPPQLSVPAELAFGSQPVGTRSGGRALAISNTSTNLATLTELSTTGDFTVSDTCATIAAGATCSPLVFFQPTVLGPRVGTLTIRTLRDANPYTVNLTGTGAENRQPVLEVTATGLGFGNAFIGMPVTREVTLRNVGLAPLVVTGIALSGDFFADTACITTIAPSASCTVHVTFYPSSAGRQAGMMQIHSNAADSPRAVELGGTGCFLPSPSRARFGILLCGS